MLQLVKVKVFIYILEYLNLNQLEQFKKPLKSDISEEKASNVDIKAIANCMSMVGQELRIDFLYFLKADNT